MKIKYTLILEVESASEKDANQDVKNWLQIENQCSKWSINNTKLVKIKLDNKSKSK